ncbi:homoserine/homoserine lactone efflux protein [Polaromonas sp. OV174]|uniref:LysE family transporter n=1 Tax=Polaromonas sp. OV174 TaxID=1855300 RepID=UPI0008F42050|nr:LysE family transporter [Polaromonas sp. OV174]SFC39683.1 homoserine/homoserine lactone efflux protein [Polaromonas sp. OV174]
MDLHTWTAFFFASILIAISPGSGAVLAMSHGLSYGVRRTQATIVGLQAGLLVILIIAGAGVGSLLIASELAFSLVKILGAGYLIYIGWSQWRSSAALTPDETGAPSNVNMLSARRRFLTGFLTNVTNPKGILFMVAVLPQFISPSRPLWLQLLLMALTSVTVDLVVMHGYAFAASRLQTLFKNAQAIKWQNRLFGGLLMAVGAGLFFVKRGQQAVSAV